MKEIVIAGAIGLSVSLSGCKGPASPIFSTIENKVLSDLQAGDGLAEIEADVNALVPGLASVEELVEAAITVIVDSGVLSGSVLERAQSYKLTLAAITHHK
jgi:hypothetical protein